MTYNEFWERDYKLVESYKIKHDKDIEQETMCNWELAQYIRAAIQEVASAIYSKKGTKKTEFPKEPEPRTLRSKYLQDREKRLNAAIKEYFAMRKQEKEKQREEKSGDAG
jgi:hypothetical protein